MSRQFLQIEKGLRVFKENSDTLFIDYLFDSGAPAGVSGETDAAPVGSQYNDRTNGHIYYKKASTSSASDWIKLGDTTIDELIWRNELVRAATVDTVAAGVVDPTGFSDNESGLDGDDFTVGEFLLGDVDGVPALFEVTVVTSASAITVVAASQAIADADTFIVQVYLPDSPASQELQAIIHIPVAGAPGVKIGDINWDFADGINLPGSYTAGNGSITSADTVNSALQKLDGNQQDIQSASGIAQGSVNYGTFTGGSLADSQTSKQLFQRLEVLLEQMRGVLVSGITTIATVDSVPHASVKAVKWLIEAFEEATPANRKAFEVYALNNGTLVDDTSYAKLKLGSAFNLVLGVSIVGANMVLQATSSTAGVTVTARRIEVVKSVL